jgi:hypothetical protein
MFLAGVQPYRDDDKVLVLLMRTGDILAKGDDMVARLRPADFTERDLPGVHDVASYLELRVNQQINGYYLRQGRAMARRARRVRFAQTLLALAAVILGVLASAGQMSLSPWIGVIGTVSGAVIAHSAAARYGFLQLEYFRTAEQLKRITDRYHHSRSPSPELDDWLVSECEQVISFQNEAWMAELVVANRRATSRREDIEASIPPPV